MEQKYCLSCDEPVIDKLPGCPLQCMSAKCKAYQKKSKFDPDTKPILWVLGGPGSGKLTQCKKIIEAYGFTHLSTGDIMRDEVNSGSDRAKCLTSIMERGGLVPNDLVLAVLKEAMEKAADQGAKGYLVDGYPREKSQGIEFEKTIGRVSLILYFEASVETLTARLATRSETSDRKDDNPNTIRLRLQTFLKHNQSVIEPYGKRINAEQTPDKIFADVQKAMNPVVARARAIEADRAEAAAVERAKALKAFAGSSMNIAMNPLAMGTASAAKMAALIEEAKSAADIADKEVTAAHKRAIDAKAAAAAKKAATKPP